MKNMYKVITFLFLIVTFNMLNAQTDKGIWEDVIDYPHFSAGSIAVNSKGVVLVLDRNCNQEMDGRCALLKSVDEGNNWVKLNPKDVKGNDMYLSSEVSMEAVGKRFYYGPRNNMNSTYYYSDDDGQTWNLISDSRPPSSVHYFYGYDNRLEYINGIHSNPYLYQRTSSNLGAWEQIGEVDVIKNRMYERDVDFVRVGLFGSVVGRVQGNAYAKLSRPKRAVENILNGIYGNIYVTSGIGEKLYGGNPLSYSNDNGKNWKIIETAKLDFSKVKSRPRVPARASLVD
jgi:hypothetical protein